ncbi:MAG: winged helix-turn-helix domain-containing protein [Thermomicrobiales bacterium]|nr:winged helix-turn-helix domain-containing protein [Thermomicrobiales bacterium]MCO5228353.1 winged helix-turn-helix domain-containing protein [Thermomicrobiales bacterium]
MTTSYEPEPYLRLSDPHHLKALADPRRMQIMRILSARAATNQQIANILQEPPARVLHHLRTLIDAGLVVLVDEHVRGGNVEKYYRATARVYGFDLESEAAESITSSVLTSIVSEVVASLQIWPDAVPEFEGRRARLSPTRLQAFSEEMNRLINDYWGGPNNPIDEDDDADLYAIMSVIYRFPGEPA